MSVSGQVIALEPNVDHFMGPNLRLVNCNVVSKAAARNIFFSDAELIDGLYEQRVPLKNFHFTNVHFSRVRFLGEYVGCDFGDWDNPNNSRVVGCDFSAAIMQDCRFLNTDMRLNALPAWPHFSLHNPADARKFVLAGTWPKAVHVALKGRGVRSLKKQI